MKISSTVKKIRLGFGTLLVMTPALTVIFFLFADTYALFHTAMKMETDRIDRMEKANLSQINNKLNYSLNELVQVVRKNAQSPSMLKYIEELRANKSDYYKRNISERKLYMRLIGIMSIYDAVDSIFLDAGGSLITDIYPNDVEHSGRDKDIIRKIRNSGIYDNIKKSADNVVVIGPGHSGFSNNKIMIATIVYNGHEELGLMVFVIKNYWIYNLFEQTEGLVITDESNGSLIYAGSRELSGLLGIATPLLQDDPGNLLKNIDGRNYKIHYTRQNSERWLVATIKESDGMYLRIIGIRAYSVLSFAASLAACVLISLFMVGRLSTPIKKLIKDVETYGSGTIEEMDPKQVKNRLPVRRGIFLYLVVTSILPLFINSTMLYFTISGKVEENIRQSIRQAAVQTADNIDYFVKVNERISLFIAFDINTQKTLVYGYENSLEDYREYEDAIKAVVGENLSLSDNIIEVSVYDSKFNTVFSTSNINANRMDKSVYPGFFNDQNRTVELVYRKDRYNRNIVTLIRKIKSKGYDNEEQIGHMMKTIGYLSITYYEMFIEELYRDLRIPGGNVYIVDENGIMLSNRTKSSIGEYIGYDFRKRHQTDRSWYVSNNKGFITFFTRCSTVPWIITEQIPYRDVFIDIRQVLAVNIFMFILCSVLVLLFSYIISGYVLKFVRAFGVNLARFGEGDGKVEFESDSRINEIEQLGETFRSMARKNRELMQKLFQAELKEVKLAKERKDAELVALQAQINPHFLYNTFDTVTWLIKDDQKKSAIKIITVLGNFYRMCVRNSGDFITICEELKYAGAYVEIQKLRLGGKLSVCWDIDENLKCFMIPKLVLQPVIENAIIHGVQEKAGQGRIDIICREDEGNIMFIIQDDGPGIDPGKLEEIREGLSGTLAGKSIGIFNVQKRLKLFFGEPYGITLDSGSDRGTTATLLIPEKRETV